MRTCNNSKRSCRAGLGLVELAGDGGTVTEITMGRIGVGMRFVALLIDGVILFIVRWILLIPFGVKVTVPPNATLQDVINAASGAAARAALIGGLVTLAYFVTEIVMAASPGKQ